MEQCTITLENSLHELAVRIHAQEQAYVARLVQVEHVQATIKGVTARLADQVIMGHELRVQCESDQQKNANNKQGTRELASQVTLLEQEEKEVCVCVVKQCYRDTISTFPTFLSTFVRCA
jgi:hypothetical protein